MNTIFIVTFTFFFGILVAPIQAADSLWVGFDTATPIQLYSLDGVYQQDFGPTGASAAVVQNGLVYVVQPSISGLTSTVTAFNASQVASGSFSFPGFVDDAAPGLGSTIWLAGYDGTVSQVSTTGQILSSFATGYTGIGVASSGSLLYTTEGDAADGIDVRNASGAVLSTIYTGYSSLYGLAYDAANSTLYAGSTDYVYQFDQSGNLLSTDYLPGDDRTPNGAVHSGLAVADLSSISAVTTTPTTAIPEPATGWLAGLLLVGGAVFARRGALRRSSLAAWAGLIASPAFASVAVNLSLSQSVVPVGTPVVLTASASDSTSASATFTYRFSVASNAGPYAVVRDFYKTGSFTWAPSDAEGSYSVQVTVRSSTGASGFTDEPLTVTSRIMSGSPAVSATANPLVALYSAPACAAPATVRVRFKSPSAVSWQATPFKTCTSKSVNFYIAGMRQNTTYTMQQDLYNGPFDTIGPALAFTTGAIPASVPVSPVNTATGPVPPTSSSYPFILQMTRNFPFAADLSGAVVWYLSAYSPANNPHEGGLPFRTTNAGTILGAQDDPSTVCPTTGQPCSDHQFLREFDLAGNIVRETNATILNQELNALRASEGKPPVHLSYINHEAYRLPNGGTAVQMSDEEIANQGSGNVDVVGDVVVVLDANFQLAWYWDAFDHLDITRKALLGDTCGSGQGGCIILYNKQPNGQYYTISNDWTHLNSIALDPKDNNLVISIRNQAWVLKLRYLNGAGDAATLWTLGSGGSFRLPGGYPQTDWFSYQHDATFQSDGTLTLFDNGNYRVSLYGGNSRGQAWQLDQVNMIATPVANFDLGSYSYAVGFASRLSNGNYDFGAGFVAGVGEGQTSEFTPNGTLVFRQTEPVFSYRPTRLPSLYSLQ